MSAWVNMDNVNDIQTIWGEQVGGYGANGIVLYVDSYQTSDRQIRVESGNGGTGALTASAAGVFTPNTWHNVALVVDHTAGTGLIYLDGVNVTAANAVRTDCALTNVVNLGTFDGGAFGFHGIIDEARIRTGTNSPNWIWASYMTVASNSVFQTYGSYSTTVVNVKLNAQMSGGQLMLTWSQGTLQSASSANGPYNDVVGATSPYAVTPTGPAQFYRVKVH